MYNRYTCPLQPCKHLTLKLLIQGHPRSAKVPNVADSFRDTAWTRFSNSRSLQQGQRSNQGHTMTLHTYTPNQGPYKVSPSSRPPAHLDTMGEK